MRDILNISLPGELKKVVENEVKKGSYASSSEFIRHLLRLWKEEKLHKELEASRKEISAGRGKVLKSLKNLR